MIKLNIVPNDQGGYTATCDEFPDISVSAPTYGLCESMGFDAVNDARHVKLIQEPKLEADAAEYEAMIAKAAGAVAARKRGRPRKEPEPVLEGADVEGVTMGPVGNE